jgi:hypothetical protein
MNAFMLFFKRLNFQRNDLYELEDYIMGLDLIILKF